MATRPVRLTPADVMSGDSPLVLTAVLRPVAGQDRFQPAGFPEIGHVIYKAPRGRDDSEDVCIVDSSASMANHLESVCMRSPYDPELVDDLDGMPYLRCVTDADLTESGSGRRGLREVVVTSLTEAHRLASTYFLAGKRLRDGTVSQEPFEGELADEIGVAMRGSKKAHVPVSKWWEAFRTVFKYDPNSLVHGLMIPPWNLRISRVLTAHSEALGASRVDSAGIKFDRLGHTKSGQAIFAVDETTAREIRATFVLDVALVRSFGRRAPDQVFGLDDSQKVFLIALALWKINRLISSSFRFRSGCHLQCVKLTQDEKPVEIDVDVKQAIKHAGFRKDKRKEPVITDIYWPASELYRDKDAKDARDAKDSKAATATGGASRSARSR